MASDGRQARRPALVRFVRVAVAVAASLAALYALAVNVFLSTSLLTRVVNANPDSIDIHFRHAWSLVPGYVQAKHVSIRGRDSHLEWRITLGEAKFRVSLLGLLKRRFEASNVRVKGATFRFRQRLDAAPASLEAVTHLPPIAGFPPYSVRPPKKPPPKAPPAAHETVDVGNDDDSFALRLESVVVEDVREVWLDHARFEGSARIDGRFYLKPGRAVEVGPAHVAVAHGQLATGKGHVAEALDGSVLDLTLARFEPGAPVPEILRGLSVACDAHVSFPELARLPMPLSAGVSLRGPVQVHRAALHIDSGVLKKDSRLAATAPHVIVTSGSHRVTGGLALEAGVALTDKRDQFTFRAKLKQIEASRRLKPKGEMRPVLHAPKVVATGDSIALGLARFLEDLHVVIEVPDGKVANTRELSSYIPPTAPVALLGGDARAELHYEAWLAEKRATGRGVLRGNNLQYSLAKMRVRGNVAIRGEFAAYHFGTRRLDDARIAIETSDGTLSSSSAPDTPLVRVATARLRAQAAVVDLADPLRAMDVSISLPSVRIMSAGLLRNYLPKGSEMQIATSDSRFSLNCNIVIAEHLARGVLDLKSQDLAIHYRDLRLDAQVGARARVHDWRWERGDLALDEARIDVNDITISKADARDARAVAMSIERIGVGAKSAHFKFEDPLAKVRLSASFVGAKVHDFAAVNAFLPENATFALEGKDATFGAGLDIDIEDHTGTGTLRATASNIGAGKGRVHLGGNVELFADFADWSFREDKMTLRDSRLEMTGVAGRFRAGGPPQLTAKRLSLSTRAPIFDLAQPTLKGSDFHFVFENGELADARALSEFLAPDGVVRIDSGAAHVAANVSVSHSRRTANGSVEIALKRGGVRLHETRLSGDFRFLARISGFDPERRALDISGTRLEMQNVAVTGATATTSHWRGNVALSRASLRLAPPALLDGVVRIDARDARPLLAIVFGNDLPGFVVGLMDMPRLTGSMRLVAGADQLALLDLDAGGGDFSLRGSYAVRGDHRRGGVIAKKGFLSAGLKLDDEGAHLRLFGLNGWLRDQNCAVSEQLQMPRAGCPRRQAQALAPTRRTEF